MLAAMDWRHSELEIVLNAYALSFFSLRIVHYSNFSFIVVSPARRYICKQTTHIQKLTLKQRPDTGRPTEVSKIDICSKHSTNLNDIAMYNAMLTSYHYLNTQDINARERKKVMIFRILSD